MLQKIRENRLVLATGALFILLAVVHIPNSIFPHAFDKNASVELLVLVISAAFFGAFILLKPGRFLFSGRAVQAIWLLAAAVAISTILSSDPIASLTGDAGRYTGVVSLLCLLVASIYHAHFEERQIKKLIALYLIGVWATVFLGILQYYKVISLPGDVGFTSTLGNQDFFAAFVGTSLPLALYLVIDATRKRRAIVGALVLSALFALYLAGRRQAFVDIAIALIAIALYLLRRFIPRKDLSLNAKNLFATIGFIIWIEGIFLMPFLGKSVPLLGSDGQVQIRGQFWSAGVNEFAHNFIFGVGPDQYGNFYEQYRTIGSVKQFANVLSNDAHASTVQTLATVGLVGAAAFMILVAILVRSILILIERRPEMKKPYLVLALYFIVFMTNSAVSPITLPNKFIFWALAGFVVGSAYRAPKSEEIDDEVHRNFLGIRGFVAIAISISLFVIVNLDIAEFKYFRMVEHYSTTHQPIKNYRPSAFLPCTVFFDQAYNLVLASGVDEMRKYAMLETHQHPRCVSPHLFIARQSYNLGDLKQMKKEIFALEKIAPDRTEFLYAANAYAQRVGDTYLQQQVVIQLEKLGIINFTKGTKSATSSTPTSK
jgi:O-antigen ligase